MSNSNDTTFTVWAWTEMEEQWDEMGDYSSKVEADDFAAAERAEFEEAGMDVTIIVLEEGIIPPTMV